MKDYYEQRDETCNLPDYCECYLCKHWEDNGWDKNLDPVWLNRSHNDEEDS